jgi:hypothetical protein
VTDEADGAPDDETVEAAPAEETVVDDTGEADGVDVVDTNVDRMIDRLVQSSGGAVTGNAMIGMAKGMGLYKKVEIAAEIREVGPPEPDDEDPIEVTIDPDHPENTRIVYRVRPDAGAGS